MTTLQTQLAAYERGLATMRQFVAEYDSKIPDGLGFSYVDKDDAAFMVNLAYRSETDRQRALQVMGDLFGRDGWTAKPDHNNKAFDWNKTLDTGMRLAIYGAEKLPELVPMLVPPSKFPIQLEDETE